jgi:polygalacturonase
MKGARPMRYSIARTFADRRAFLTGMAASAVLAPFAAVRAAAGKCGTGVPAWTEALRERLEAMAEVLQRSLRPWDGPNTLFQPEAFGWRGEGMATRAIQAAIDAAAARGGIVRLARGEYLSGTIVLRSNVRLEVAGGARLVASTNLADYPEHVASRRTVMDTNMGMNQSLIFAEGCANISISGEGTIDGRGDRTSFPGAETSHATPGRPFLIRVLDCRRVHVAGITLLNAACWMQNYLNCDELLIENITVSNQANFNNDGIDIDGCRKVIVRGCLINSEDDGLCFKGAAQRPTDQVLVEDCRVYSTCNGVKFGTDSQGDFRNVLIRRIETGGPPQDLPAFHRRNAISGFSWESVDGGTVEDVYAYDVRIVRSASPIFLRLGDRARVKPEDPRPAPGHLRRIVFDRVTGSDNGARGSLILGLPERLIEDIVFSRFNLAVAPANRSPPLEDAIPEQRDTYPDAAMIGELSPAYALWSRHAMRITLAEVRIQPTGRDPRPAYKFSDVQQFCAD